MSPLVLLRIAAVIGLLFGIGHSLGAPWTPGSGADGSAAVIAMKSTAIPEMSARTYWDFYFGFGVSISVYLFALAVVLWQTASLARTAFDRARPFMATLFVAYLAVAVVALRYFFIVPTIMAIAVCLLITVAWLSGQRKKP